MIWIAYGGVIGALLLFVIATVVVWRATARVKTHAENIVPSALLKKIEKARDDAARLQGASVLAQELVERVRALR